MRYGKVKGEYVSCEPLRIERSYNDSIMLIGYGTRCYFMKNECVNKISGIHYNTFDDLLMIIEVFRDQTYKKALLYRGYGRMIERVCNMVLSEPEIVMECELDWVEAEIKKAR